MTELSVCLPYYENPRMLAWQYQLFSELPPEVKNRIEVVVVDDGSPEHPAEQVTLPAGLPAFHLFRISVDVPWNNHSARNVAAHEAKGPWILMTDIDHVLLDYGKLLARCSLPDDPVRYTFFRVDAPDLAPKLRENGSNHVHLNSFAVRKTRYWKAGGYDEDFAGIYGLEGLFLRRLNAFATDVWLPDVRLMRVSREVIPDASTRTLPRKEGRPQDAAAKVVERKAREGRSGQIRTLTFPYRRVR